MSEFKNFKEKDKFNNKCRLEKRPTYYYLELFANLFNKNFKDHMIKKLILDSYKNDVDLEDNKAPLLNSMKTNLGIKYNANEDLNNIIDADFKIRLQVKESTLDEDVETLQIEIQDLGLPMI